MLIDVVAESNPIWKIKPYSIPASACLAWVVSELLRNSSNVEGAWKVPSRRKGNHYHCWHLCRQLIYNPLFKYWILCPWHVSFTLTCCPLCWLTCCAATKDFHSCLYSTDSPGVLEDLQALHPLSYTRWSWNGRFNILHRVLSSFGWFLSCCLSNIVSPITQLLEFAIKSKSCEKGLLDFRLKRWLLVESQFTHKWQCGKSH